MMMTDNDADAIMMKTELSKFNGEYNDNDLYRRYCW